MIGRREGIEPSAGREAGRLGFQMLHLRLFVEVGFVGLEVMRHYEGDLKEGDR